MRGAARRFWLQIFPLAAALLAGGCTSVAPPAATPLSAAARISHNRDVFDRSWKLIDRHFFDQKFGGQDWPGLRAQYRPLAETAPDDDALYRTLNNMIAELHASHVVAISPRYVYEDRTHLRAAVGIRFRRVEQKWVVTDVVPASPAERAGVQRGWLIDGRNGRSLGDNPRLPLALGESVTYDFLDLQDHPQSRTMTAESVSTQPKLEARELPGGLLYLRFDEFTWANRGWLNRQLKAHRSAQGVVIDLRENPGGNAIALWAALGDFFDHRVAAGTFIRRNGRTWNTKSFHWFSADYRGPLAVMVDGGSASCSEIFAHVLRYHGRAEIVGRKTAGAVILSWYYRLPGGGRLQVAIQDYKGLDGQRLEGVGITPDHEVSLKLADLRSGRDADLDLALACLKAPTTAAAASP
jgi:carboxyl-terminal processing protease